MSIGKSETAATSADHNLGPRPPRRNLHRFPGAPGRTDLVSPIVDAFAFKLAVGAATLILATAPAGAADPDPGAADPGASSDMDGGASSSDAYVEPGLRGPVPFVESEPLLAELRGLLAERAPSKKALSAGLAVLRDWLERPHADPLARPTGLWLEARLLTALGKKTDARAAWEALATTPGPFSDEAREVLADLDDAAHRPAAAAHWRLTRAPWSPGFLAGAHKAAHDLSRLGQAERAIELLDQALLQGMHPSTRTELVLLLADLHRAAKHQARAQDILLQTWWSLPGEPDAGLTRALRAERLKPDKDLVRFREALDASRAEAARLLKNPPRGRGPLDQATLALLMRWDDKTAATALESLPALPAKPSDLPPKKRPSEDALAALALTRGILLRKLDRDAEAIDAFMFIHEHLAAHPLAHEARDQAATLMRMHGRDAEAEPLDRRILADALPGDLHRAALWRLGFGAVLARDPSGAQQYLRALEWRHGGDPDRHSFCWFERARYWRARAAQLAGDTSEAQTLWRSLVQRYPAGWYALLARLRLGTPPPGSNTPPSDLAEARLWEVPADDPMATALALFRLGEEQLALDHFDALLAANQLPGNGRRLLSDLLELAGDTRRASRVLRYAAIPPTMPGDDPDEAYFDWYPLRFEEALGQAARDNGLPSSLLAGLVSVETRFSESARSHVGAIGAAQLMKKTGTAVGRKVFGAGFDARSLTDPDVNLAVAARYLADLLERFKGHPALAVAAYNAGPAPVKKWLEARGRLELDAFVETIPFEQARRYVMRVLSDAEIYRRLYGLDGRPVALPLSFDRAAVRDLPR